MRCLVTGASGFVGSRLCRALAARGADVGAIIVPGCNLDQLRPVLSRIQVFEHDGKTESLIAIAARVNPDIVYHLASLVLGDHDVSQITPLITSNILFGTQLLEAMSRCGIRRLVNTSSYWQHFLGDSSYSPVNLYAATKQAFEDILTYFVDADRVQAITLKLFDNYGNADPRPKLLNLLKQAASTGRTLEMSPGEQYIDLLHVTDVVEAFLCAGERLLEGSVKSQEFYAVRSGRPVQLRSLVDLAARVWGRTIPVAWGARPYRVRELMTVPRCAGALPGWQPQITLEVGLATMANDPG